MSNTDNMNNLVEAEHFLSIKDLVVSYHTDGGIVRAVNGVSLTIHEGETLGLVGETGAGKTTIARSILRIVPNPPGRIENGEIWFKGKDLLSLSKKDMQNIRGDHISMIFQDPMTALNPVLTVGEQIAEAIKLHKKVSMAEAVKEAGDALELVGIPRIRYSEYPHQFSGGMKQRVVIAIALACDPDLILADEPTTALDVTIQAQVLEMINDLKVRLNKSMIMITHDLGIVAETCDRVAVIYAGEVVECGTTRQIFKNTSHPYTQGLFNSLPNADDIDDISLDDRRLKPIPGMMPDPTNLPESCKFGERCPYCTEECLAGPIPMIELGDGHQTRCIHHEMVNR